MFEKKIVGILLVFVLLATGFSGNVSAKSGGGCGCLAVVDHGVFLNNTTDENTLLIWVDGGDVFFTSSYNDYYNTTLQGVLGRVDVLRYETDDWGEYGFYTAVYVELNLSLKTIDSEPYRSFRYLSDAIVLLWSHGDRELYETLVDIARTEVFSNILYSENLTSPDDVAKSLFLYTKAEEKLGEDKVPAAVALYNAALYNLPTTPTLMWDKITRLSYNGNNTHPVVFSSGGVLHAGWIHREDGGVNYTFYARSTNLGRTWWTLDATTYGSPYLVAMGLDPYGGDPFVAMAATQLLESIYLIDGSHYFYVPINTPPVLPIPVDGEVGDTIYVSIDDPYLDRYQTYEYLRIGDRLFIKPICKPGGTPVPPPRAPDLVVEEVYSDYGVEFVDTPTNVHVVVKNVGDADVVGDIRVKVCLDGEEQYNDTITGLAQQQTYTIDLSWDPSTEKDYNWTATVDPTSEDRPRGDIEEGDENNNIKTEYIAVFTEHGNTGFEPYYHYVGEENKVMRDHNILINSANGNLYVSPVDIHVKGWMFNLDIKRAYNSQRNHILSPFGYGWTYNYDQHLIIQDNNDITYIDTDGTEFYYHWNGTGYETPNGTHDQLSKNKTSGNYELYKPDGSKLVFSPGGKLLEITDKNNNQMTFTYDNNLLVKIEENTGLYYNIQYNDNNLISTIIDPIGRKVSYVYDENLNLIEVIDPNGNATRYSYDTGHRLIKIIDRVNTGITFTYKLAGREGRDRTGQVYRGLYNPDTGEYQDSFMMYSFKYYAYKTIITNARGVDSTIEYNKDGNPTHIGSPVAGYRFKRGNMTWENGNMTSYTDPRGYTTTYEYDQYGNKIKETGPLGYTRTWEYRTINTLGLLSSKRYISYKIRETNKLGYTWTYEYDSHGNRIKETDPLGNTKITVYGTWTLLNGGTVNGVVLETRHSPHITYDYDQHGNVIKETYDDGTNKSYTYNEIGWMLSSTDEDGYTTTYEYDNNGNLVKETDPLGYSTTYVYDGEGRRIATIDKLGHMTRYVYDSLSGWMTEEIDPLGYSTRYEYDDAGNIIKTVDKNGNPTFFEYDSENRKIKETDALGYAKTWKYDETGNVIEFVDKNGAKTTYTYDAMNRKTGETDPLGYTTTYKYDAEGHLVEITNPRGYTTTISYDPLGREVNRTDPLGYTTTKEYDNYSRLIKEVSKDGAVTTYTYDVKDRLVSKTDVTGTTTYTYDGRGNRISETNPLGYTTTYTYDALGRRTSVTTPMGYTTTYNYDAMGRLVSITDPNGNKVFTYTYNDRGDKVSETTALGHKTTYSYDGDGNIISRTDPNDNTTTYTYDKLGRLVKISYPDGSYIKYVYDAMGHVTESQSVGTGARDHLYFQYDLAGHLTRVDAYVAGFHLYNVYTYDENGNKISVENPVYTVSYEYDPLDRVSRIVSPNPFNTSKTDIIEYAYDPAGRVTKIDYYVNNVTPDSPHLTQTYTYNASGFLVRQEAGIDGPLLSINYTYDTLGRLIEKEDMDGTTTYTYDNDSRLSRVVYPWGDTTTYTYDGVGNRLEMTVNNKETTYTYNADNQLLSISDGTTYRYDSNGNLISKTTSDGEKTLYRYDYENRLIGIELPNGSNITYNYCRCPRQHCGTGYSGFHNNPLLIGGKRVSKTINGETTYYFYDGEDITLEFNTTGVLMAAYTHGPGVDNPLVMYRNGLALYYVQDRLGSVVGLVTLETGGFVQTYTYDAWGNIVSQSGDVKNPYTYTGREYDPESGLYYYRARYYDSTVGRFLQRDPAGTVDGTSPYLYADNNPVFYRDPIGYAVWGPPYSVSYGGRKIGSASWNSFGLPNGFFSLHVQSSSLGSASSLASFSAFGRTIGGYSNIAVGVKITNGGYAYSSGSVPLLSGVTGKNFLVAVLKISVFINGRSLSGGIKYIFSPITIIKSSDSGRLSGTFENFISIYSRYGTFFKVTGTISLTTSSAGRSKSTIWMTGYLTLYEYPIYLYSGGGINPV